MTFLYQNRATAPRRRNQPSGGLSVRPRQSPCYHSDLPQVLRVRGWFPEFAPGDEEILTAAKRDLARLRKNSFYWSFARVKQNEAPAAGYAVGALLWCTIGDSNPGPTD